MSKLQELLDLAQSQVGYAEKDNAAALDSMSIRGSKNFTKYARDINAIGLLGCQGQPWCGSYQFWLDYKAFDKPTALANLGPQFYNCFATMNWAKEQGRWLDRAGTPKPGYRVIFSQSHIALVTRVTASKIHTNEGNTSDGSGVNRDGGSVCNKSYERSYGKILGYVVVEYEEDKKSGWSDENGGRRYYNGDTGKYVSNDWVQDVGNWYWFDAAGMMVNNVWYRHNGHWYYLGADGSMVKGLQAVDGKWYYLGQDGKMVVEPVTLSPDNDGALRYPGIGS